VTAKDFQKHEPLTMECSGKCHEWFVLLCH